MLKLLKLNKKNSFNTLENILNKRKSTQKNSTKAVQQIISNVKKNGDKAVIKYEKKFSKFKTHSAKIIFSKQELSSIANQVDKKIPQRIFRQ